MRVNKRVHENRPRPAHLTNVPACLVRESVERVPLSTSRKGREQLVQEVEDIGEGAELDRLVEELSTDVVFFAVQLIRNAETAVTV